MESLLNIMNSSDLKRQDVFLGGIAFIACGFAMLAIHRILLHPLRNIPGPFVAKMSGLYMSMTKIYLNRAHALRNLHDKYGSVVRIGPNEVSIADWRMYRKIYRDRSILKDPAFYHPFEFLGKGNVFATCDTADHAARKKLMGPTFSFQQVNSSAYLIVERTDVLIDRITREAYKSSTRTVNVFDLLGIWSVEVICKVMFDTQFSDSEEQMSAMCKAMETSPPTFFANIVAPWLKDSSLRFRLPGSLGRAYKSFEIWRHETEIMLEDFSKRSLNGKKNMNFLGEHLLSTVNKHLDRTYSRKEALEEAMGVTIAGSQVTQHTLLYLLFAISRPEGQAIQQRMREELSSAGNTLSDLQKLPYLTAVIRETYRLYPAIMSTLPRILTQPLQIEHSGVTLPPGTHVGMQNYVHHRDAQMFRQPDEFLPERWLEGNSLNKGLDLEDMQAAITPFSVGTRTCLGQNLAHAQLYLATARIMGRLKLSLNDSMMEDDMFMQDLWAVFPKGQRLLLDVEYF